MSGGLLDKAKKEGYSDSVHQGDNIVNDPEAIITAYEKGKKAASDSKKSATANEKKKESVAKEVGTKDGGLLSKAPTPKSPKKSGPSKFYNIIYKFNNKFSNMLSTLGDSPILLYAAVFTLLLSMGLLYFMYLIPFDYAGYLILVILLGSGYLASLYIKTSKNDGKNLNPMQWCALVVAYLLLAGIPYVAAMDFGGSLLLSDAEVTMDESTGASVVTMNLRHSSGLFGSDFSEGDVDIKVKQSGCDAWTDTRSVSLDQKGVGDDDYGVITLMVSDFYCNNALQIDGVTPSGGPVLKEVPYVVTVSVDGASTSITLPTFALTKSVTDVDERATGHDTDQNCQNSNHETCIDYIQIQGWVGEGTDEPPNNASIPARINGQYDINMNFVFMDGESATIENYGISVVGTSAVWDEPGCGESNDTSKIGDLTTEFYFMCNGDTFFDSDTALSEGYGCYSLTVTANQGGVEVATSTSYYMYEEIEEEGGNGGNPAYPPGTYYWEEFNEDPTCAPS